MQSDLTNVEAKLLREKKDWWDEDNKDVSSDKKKVKINIYIII